MKFDHAWNIDHAEHIDVMQKKWFVPTSIFEKEPRSFLEAATGIEQSFFTRDFNPHVEVVVLPQIIDNHVGKVMHVDDHFTNPEPRQTTKRDLQQRMTSHLDESFGTIVGKRAKTGAQARSQNHCPHCREGSTAAFAA